MSSLFAFVALGLLVLLVIGLASPDIFSRLLRRKLSRKQIASYVGTATLLFFLLSGLTAPAKEEVNTTSGNSNQAQMDSGQSTTATSTPADRSPPIISSIQPGATISTASATASAYYNDTGSGINKATIVFRLDGVPLGGCATTDVGITCPLAGLNQGQHDLNISVTDNAGNVAKSSGSFTVSIPGTSVPAGATARCNDGTYSYSKHRRGTCSQHDGVAEWLADLPD